MTHLTREDAFLGKIYMFGDRRFRVISWSCPQPGQYYLASDGTLAFETGRFETMFNDDKLDPRSCRHILREILGTAPEDPV